MPSRRALRGCRPGINCPNVVRCHPSGTTAQLLQVAVHLGLDFRQLRLERLLLGLYRGEIDLLLVLDSQSIIRGCICAGVSFTRGAWVFG